MKTASHLRTAIAIGAFASLITSAGLTPTFVGAQETERTMATGSNIPLAPDAPDSYTVKAGDTLWGIAKIFLRDPWYWPEIWSVNPQIQNPHLIYPGDLLRLVFVDGQPRLIMDRGGAGADDTTVSTVSQDGRTVKLSPRVRVGPLDQAITSIPYEVIAGFIGRPVLLEKNEVKKAPYLVGMRDGRTAAAAGNEIYARGLAGVETDTRYNLVHIEEPLRDPETNDLLGYTGIYVGTGPVVRAGDPAKLVLLESAREALLGDKLFPESTAVQADFIPRPPSQDVDAAVISIHSQTITGQYQILAINRGIESGLEPGHVLAVYQAQEPARGNYSQGGLSARRTNVSRQSNWLFGKKTRLPEEVAGIVMVFKSYDRMSFCLVMEGYREIRDGDRARNPE